MSGDRRTAAAIACAVGCALSLFAQRALFEAAARLQSPVDLFFDPKRPVSADVVRSLPYKVVDVVFAPPTSIHVALIVVGVVQALLLLSLYRALRARIVATGERAVLALVAAVMFAIAFGAGAIDGFDDYALAGYAWLGPGHAYAPPAAPLPGAFSLVSTIWGVPMPPSSDGPGWLALTAAVAGHAPSIGAAIFALRVLEALALVALIALVARRGLGAGATALVALNPALYFVYVANAHPDLFAAVLLVGALAAVASLPLLAVALIACAALVKLPMILLAPAVFAARDATRDAIRLRLAYVVLAAAVALLVSYLLGGVAYFHAAGAELRNAFVPVDRAAAVAVAVRVGLLIVAAVALVTVFVRGTARPASAWSLIALSPPIVPAALAWTLPYAAQARAALVPVLILLPVVAALLDVSFPHAGLGLLTMFAVLVWAVVENVRARRTGSAGR
ncbi:MAG TPA: hypothetical protein VHT05_05465 [Candidatus Elarobacter sp.]|nr:hypothetical protein [Candidatus Elarobacter sp.]